MCDHEELYEYFPAMIIGGPTGDYELSSPVTSGRWVEYRIVSLLSITGATSFVVSGNSKPVALAQDASKTLTANQFVTGEAYYFGSGTANVGGSIIPIGHWQRVTHSQKKIFARIDTTSNFSAYVTIQFRNRILTRVPGPSTTVHPDHAQQLNIARADATRERLGVTKEIATGEGLNANRK